jgi:hypothetical protein
VGNAAADQLQLDVYGHLLQTAWLYAQAGGRLDSRSAARLASTADLVSASWRGRDSGIWEVRSAPQHFTQSKLMCWIALDRACRLAAAGHIPAAGCARWKGPLVRRYRGDDGLKGEEGAFLACSFWLVDALARLGDVQEATCLMQELVALGNDVGPLRRGDRPRRPRLPRELPPRPRAPGARQRRRDARRGDRRVTLPGALAGGFVGTLVLTTAMRAATELRLMRIDLPFLLGTAFSAERTRAGALGYALHFVFGLLFAGGYYAIFQSLGMASWWLGAVLGVLHAAFAGTALVNVLLPLVHPRMGSAFSDASSAPLLEPPGVLLLNYGARTPLVMLAVHVAYGALVGVFIAGSC